jgi:tight adherence protein B
MGIFVIALALLGVPAAAAALALLAGSVPLVGAVRSTEKAAARRRDTWPDILFQVRSSVAAGTTLGDALVTALSHAGGDFATMADRIRVEVAFGGGFQAALEESRAIEDDPTADRILVTLAAAGSAGGVRVGTTIGHLARSVSDEIRLRKAHDAALTEQRLTINVALFAPWVLLVLSIVTNPQAAGAFSTTQGAIVILTGALATTVGWLLATRTSRLRKPQKVFR